MCVTVYIKKTDNEIESVGQFKEAFPDVDIISYDGNESLVDEECLCPIDLDATFKKAGICYVYDSMEYIIL